MCQRWDKVRQEGSVSAFDKVRQEGSVSALGEGDAGG